MINVFGILITIFVYLLYKYFSNAKIFKIIPPIVVCGLCIIAIMFLFSIDYKTYTQSTGILTYLLGPATIALGYPLIKHFNILKTYKRAIYFGLLFATIIAVLSTYFVATLMHADFNVILSLIPKSVTAPIAIEISKSINGSPELTACIVVLTGVTGGIFGHLLLKFFKVKSDIAIGLSMGAASHMLGTARCSDKNRPRQVVISTVSLIIVGFLTAIIAPILINFVSH